ncbi:MAG: VOC family protein [Saprospiraceae bacterium]|nr:VOC family protein [Saprospiraceae bacterium]
MSYQICGIQQVGLGNKDVHATWKFYRKNLGMDMPIFDEEAKAGLMLPYTNGQVLSRHAILALNFQGGGGLEIWQHKEHIPQDPSFVPELGDTGIYILKFKAKDIDKLYHQLKSNGVHMLSNLTSTPNWLKHFYFEDDAKNIIEAVEAYDWYADVGLASGGVYGCTIGVSDMDVSLNFYADILGYDHIIFDETSTFQDFSTLPGGNGKFRRVILGHSKNRKGPFADLLGSSQIELVQKLEGSPRKIYADRLWGDPGFIHLCFDIIGMDDLKQKCLEAGHPFTIDSDGSFDMGEAAGRFCYIEDPDGTLIEFVETHKVPILKKLNWYLNLKNRPRDKSLPRWMLKAMSWTRIKD